MSMLESLGQRRPILPQPRPVGRQRCSSHLIGISAMGDHKPSIVAPKALGVVDGSAYPQAEIRVPTIALGTMRSTMNALRTRMNREGAAHTIARSLVTHHRSRVSSRLQTKVF